MITSTNLINLDPFQEDMNYFVDFCYFRLTAAGHSVIPIIDKMFDGWTEKEIKGAFQEAEISASQGLYCEDGEWKTKSKHPLAHYFIEHLTMVCGKYGMTPSILTSSSEYGIFEWAEPSSTKGGMGIGGSVTISRELYTWETRPKLEGKITRRMYQGADYCSAGRALSLGLIERKTTKTVIWLSPDEHKKVLKYLGNKRKNRGVNHD